MWITWLLNWTWWENKGNIFILPSLVSQTVKRLPTVQETWVRSLGREDPLEKEMAPHSSIHAWKIPWTEELGWLLSLGSQRIGHDWATSLSLKNPPQNSQGKGFGGLLGWWTLGDLGRVVHSERMWKLFSYPLLEVSFIWLLLNSILL